jgi:CubicO group peptidase (beta-lactamase class C family)
MLAVFFWPAAGVQTLAPQIRLDGVGDIVDAAAKRALRDDGLPSLSVAVASGSRVVLSRAYGMADLEHEVAAGEGTVYRIGSITKQFTAAVVLRLAEQHRLDIDDAVGRYLTALPKPARDISIRQLLNHTSGIRSFTAIPAFASKARLDLTDDELLDVFKNEPLDFEPGANFLYNNTAYYLLAMVIENVTGRTYADYMRDELFIPLGLADTSACDDRRLVPQRAHGYTVSAGVVQNAPFISMLPPKGGGNLCSSARDLARWAQALAAGVVISQASYRLMLEPGALPDGRRIAYGLGLFVSTLDGRPEISHGGGIVGFTGFLATYPEDDLIVVSLTNSDAVHLYDGKLTREIVRAISGRRLTQASNASTAVSDFERYVGKYRMGSAVITVVRDGDLLAVDSENSVEQLWERDFVHRGDGKFAAVRNSEFRLTFTPAERQSTRLSITLSGRSLGDATR